RAPGQADQRPPGADRRGPARAPVGPGPGDGPAPGAQAGRTVPDRRRGRRGTPGADPPEGEEGRGGLPGPAGRPRRRTPRVDRPAAGAPRLAERGAGAAAAPPRAAGGGPPGSAGSTRGVPASTTVVKVRPKYPGWFRPLADLAERKPAGALAAAIGALG